MKPVGGTLALASAVRLGASRSIQAMVGHKRSSKVSQSLAPCHAKYFIFNVLPRITILQVTFYCFLSAFSTLRSRYCEVVNKIRTCFCTVDCCKKYNWLQAKNLFESNFIGFHFDPETHLLRHRWCCFLLTISVSHLADSLRSVQISSLEDSWPLGVCIIVFETCPFVL